MFPARNSVLHGTIQTTTTTTSNFTTSAETIAGRGLGRARPSPTVCAKRRHREKGGERVVLGGGGGATGSSAHPPKKVSTRRRSPELAAALCCLASVGLRRLTSNLAPQQPLPPCPDALLTSGAGCSRNPRDRAASASCRSTSPPPVPDLATAVPDLPLPSLEASPPSLPDAGKRHFPTRCGKAYRRIPG